MPAALAAKRPASTGVRPATEPPEMRGLARDGVRLLVARPSSLTHATFADLPGFLDAGDLLVVNTSATLPASVWAIRPDDTRVTVHFSTDLGSAQWAVEVRPRRRASGPLLDVEPGETLRLAGGSLTVVASYPYDATGHSRLWRAVVEVPGGVARFLAHHGQPIVYDYVPDDWPLSCYQTVFAREPGSAEMPSAGRPFTGALVVELVTRGVAVAPIVLHTGVSSLTVGEGPLPETFEVPLATARAVNAVRTGGGRVVAVGTTVARALESAARPDSVVEPVQGWTELVLSPDRPARVVDGLITGWHEPGASHLLLLESVAGRELVETAYDAARRGGYLWHEFGDSALLLPD